MLNRGADGFVIDAEAEWESGQLANAGTKATQLCQGIKNAFPTRFLAHSPFMYISLHSSFPYKQFGLLCDAVMPQAYFTSFGISPSQCVTDMDREWRNWQNSLTGTDRNAIKPLVPVCQGWNVSSSQTTTGAEITTFINGIKNDANPASVGGYKGVNFWRADLHTADMWNAIGAATIGGGGSTVSDIIIDNPAATVVGTWSTGTTAVDRFGSDYRFKNQGTGTSYLRFTSNILTAGHYNVYEWHSVGSNRTTGAPEVVAFNGGTQTFIVNQQVGGGQWNLLGNFSFATGTAGSVKITDASAGSTLVVIADAIKFVYTGP
ncbi:MAG: glycoside hydrolase family 5 [Pedosphaera sp.]|nr:glycoside hydrolase family 5 [Pedosphaera sp.]